MPRPTARASRRQSARPSRSLRLPMLAQRPAAGHHHVAEGPARAGEDQRVEQPLGRNAQQAGVLRCRAPAGRHARPPASPSARSPPPPPPAASARPNSRAAVDGSPSAGAALTLRWRSAAAAGRIRASAAPRGQARVTWLSEPIDSGTPAASQPGRSARPSPRLPSVDGQMTTPAPLRATASISSRVLCVACTSCQRASSARVPRQPFDRPLAGGLQAVVDLGGLLGHVDVDRHVAQAFDQLPRSTPARAARSEWMATPAFSSGRPLPRQRALQRQHRRGVGGKAALVVAQRRLREAGALVQHRQHRQADAGIGRRVGQRPRHASAGRHRAGRRGRAAGSGTRTPGCSRRAAARRRAARPPRAAARA